MWTYKLSIFPVYLTTAKRNKILKRKQTECKWRSLSTVFFFFYPCCWFICQIQKKKKLQNYVA